MKLIKINEEHYIVVDDSEIKEGDFVYVTLKPSICQFKEGMGKEWCKKITHSTQPLGVKPITDKVVIEEDKAGNPLVSAQYVELDMSSTVKHISLQEVKELIGEVDVEKKAEEKYPKSEFWVGSNPSRLYDENAKERRCFLEGYNQAIEDNKEKKYTEADLRKGWTLATNYVINQSSINFSKFLNSLQPKTEWEVEIVDGKLKLK